MRWAVAEPAAQEVRFRPPLGPVSMILEPSCFCLKQRTLYGPPFPSLPHTFRRLRPGAGTGRGMRRASLPASILKARLEFEAQE